MARRHDDETTLHEIEESLDGFAAFVNEYRIPIAAGAALILALALGWDRYDAWSESRIDEATAELAEARSEFLEAMGAAPGSIEIAEPANPETAETARRRFAARFIEIAEAHPESSAAVLARLDAGRLQEELGAPHLAIDTWRAALESVPTGSALRALILERIGQAHEAGDQWADAAEAYEQAGRVESSPTRARALADAARCLVRAGDPDRAVSLWAEIETLGVETEVPIYTERLLRELTYRRALDS